MPADKTTSYDSNVIIDDQVGTALNPGPYFGFERTDPAVQSTGPRVYALTTEPNGVLQAPTGSVALLTTGGIRVNVGGTVWVSTATSPIVILVTGGLGPIGDIINPSLVSFGEVLPMGSTII